MSISPRLQEIWWHCKVTHANQNHKIWLISRLLPRNPIWCKCSLDSNLCSYATGAWLRPISEASSWTRLLPFLHKDGSSNSAVTVILRELCGLLTIWNTHSLKDRSFAHRQLGTNGAKTCCLTHSFVVQPYNSDYHNGYHQMLYAKSVFMHYLLWGVLRNNQRMAKCEFTSVIDLLFMCAVFLISHHLCRVSHPYSVTSDNRTLVHGD